MAAAGLSIRATSQRTGLDERTLRKILRGEHRPHTRTLKRLADGLGVSVDELFLDTAGLLYRRFDRQTNPLVGEAIGLRPELFAGWTEAEFDELHSHFGAGGPLTTDGAIVVVERINRKRELHGKLDLLLESSHAELIGAVVDAMHREIVITPDGMEEGRKELGVRSQKTGVRR